MNEQWMPGNYLIACIDVLGQSKKILSINSLPSSPKEKSNMDLLLNETAGYIIYLRGIFNKLLLSFRCSLSKAQYYSPDEKAKFEELRSLIGFKGFSDTIFITVPLDSPKNQFITISGIYFVLLGLCGMFMESLVKHKPIRGGVEIGWGVRIACDEVYGSATAKSHILENRIAKSPRIVIGDGLWSFLTKSEQLKTRNRDEKREQKIALACKKLITEDVDSVKILDFIGQEVHSYQECFGKEWVEQSYKAAVTMHDKKVNDTKLYPRYGQLRDYMESQLQRVWNIHPIKVNE
jgi:hypothetical protein